jgi:hypothetical protein
MSEAAFNEVKQLFNTPEPAALGPEERSGTQTQAELDAALNRLLPQAKLSATNQQLVRALVLLWHDYLDASHEISQGIENADGSFIHAIMHRREPDYGNSQYWWRRVGKHPAFPEIAARVDELLQQSGAGELAKKLLPDGKWDAFAFVDACEEAERTASSKQQKLLREIQRIEFEVLLERFIPVSQ